MTGARLVATSCITFFVLPLISLGQSMPEQSGGNGAAGFAPTVSMRELVIPEKARNAYNKGTQRFARQDWAGSIAEFQKAIAVYKDFYEAYYKVGLADMELQLSAQAEAAFRKSIELSDGRFAPPLFGLGLTLGNAKQFDDALAFIRLGLTLEPTSARGNFTLAWVLYSAERVPEAEQSAKQAVQYAPNFAMPHLLLAQIDRKQKNSTAMVEELDAFLRLEPDGPRSAGVRAVRDETARALAQDQRSAETVVASGPH
jgi:tetratricopeptide (TPR) repeat protein